MNNAKVSIKAAIAYINALGLQVKAKPRKDHSASQISFTVITDKTKIIEILDSQVDDENQSKPLNSGQVFSGEPNINKVQITEYDYYDAKGCDCNRLVSVLFFGDRAPVITLSDYTLEE